MLVEYFVVVSVFGLDSGQSAVLVVCRLFFMLQVTTMPKRCVVGGCSNVNVAAEGIIMHVWPKCPKLAKKWDNFAHSLFLHRNACQVGHLEIVML